jgi:uncharacterized membrane protein YdjX (TVP38/TMEM64 family)
MVDECPCGHRMGWAAFATACAASVYFMYTGDVQRLMEALKGLGATGVVVMVAVYTVSMVLLVPGTVLNLGAGYMSPTPRLSASLSQQEHVR